MNFISYVHSGDLFEVTLNRPTKLNAFNDELIDELLDVLGIAADVGVRLVAFYGRGKGFSGGFDLNNIDKFSDGDLLLRLVKIEKMLQLVYFAPFATIAFVHGPCFGAAADLVAACHWRVAAAKSSFRMPGVRFGLILGSGRLVKLVGENSARTLILRDTPFYPEEALTKGFLTHIADQNSWINIKTDVLSKVNSLESQTFERLFSREIGSDCDFDMAELVRSASDGSIKSRITAYLKENQINHRNKGAQ